MAEATCKKLEVILGGIIAYVPDGNTLWVLMADAVVPTPARWRPMESLMAARSPHLAFLIVDEGLIDYAQTDGEIDAFFQDGDYANVSLADRPPAKAAILLLGEQLKFGIPASRLTIYPEVERFVPQMSVISPKHKYAARRFDPRHGTFDKRNPGLSAAFPIMAGDVRVNAYFGKDKPEKVDFGYVCSSLFGSPKYRERVWKREVANQLSWTVPLPDEWTEVKITSTIWENGDSSDYVLKIPDCGTLRIAIMHAETEIPALFLEDPHIPDDVLPIPDPDFEVLYGLSNETCRSLRWRVPVPRSDSSGAKTKPCAGGYFEGFK